MNCVTLLVVSACLVSLPVVQCESVIEKLDMYNGKLVELANKMLECLPDGTTSQYLLAATITNTATEELKVEKCEVDGERRVKFYQNMDWGDYKMTGDCDAECEKNIRDIESRGASTTPLGDSTTVHTELQLMYGKEGRRDIMEPAIQDDKIILVYSRFVPCSQLACLEETDKDDCTKGHYGECASDMAHYRYTIKQTKQTNVNFVVIYHQRYVAHGGLGTNLCVSELYLKNGGIPTLKATFSNGLVTELDQGDDPKGYLLNYGNPSKQTFPRYKEGGTATSEGEILKECLAYSEVIDRMTGRQSIKQPGIRYEEVREIRRLAIALQLYRKQTNGREDDYNDIDMVYPRNYLTRRNAPLFHFYQRCQEFVQCPRKFNRKRKREKLSGPGLIPLSETAKTTCIQTLKAGGVGIVLGNTDAEGMNLVQRACTGEGIGRGGGRGDGLRRPPGS